MKNLIPRTAPGPRGILLSLALLLLATAAAGDVPLVVTSLADSGPGSLREVLAAAPDRAVVRFAVSGRISLSTPLRLGGRSVTIEGGAPGIVLDGRMATRILVVASGPAAAEVTLRDVRLVGGLVVDGDGGAIRNEGNLTLERCWVSTSFAVRYGASGGNGGGIANLGRLLLVGSAVTDSAAISFSTAPASGNGGGIANLVDAARELRGEAELRESTVSGNLAAAVPATVVGRTIDAHAFRRGMGGGIWNDLQPFAKPEGPDVEAGSARLVLGHSTVAENDADWGGGIANAMEVVYGESEADKSAAFVHLVDSVVSRNSSLGNPLSPADLVGPAWGETSLVTDGALLVGTRSLVGLPGLLGPRTAAGASGLPVHLPLQGSPVVASGSTPLVDGADGRGDIRRAGIPSDLGAVQTAVRGLALAAGGAAELALPGGKAAQVRLTGSGRATLSYYPEASLLFARLEATANDTRLEVENGAGLVLAEVRADGPVGAIRAPGATLRGPVAVAGPLGELVAGEVRDARTGRVAVAAKGAEPGTLFTFGAVEGLALDVDGPVDRFEAASVTSKTPTPVLLRAASVNRILVGGRLERSRVEVAGSIGELRAGALLGSRVLAGMAHDLVGIPRRSDDFVAAGRVGKVVVDGSAAPIDEPAVLDSVVAASSIGDVDLARVSLETSATAVGLGANEVGSLRVEKFAAGRRLPSVRLAGLKGPGDSESLGAFHVAIFRKPWLPAAPGVPDGPAIPWSFAVLDDVRGGILVQKAPSGTASWNLGPLVADAYAAGASLVVVPGDLVSGFNDWVFHRDKDGADPQYRSFYATTGLVHGPGHDGDVPVFRRPDDPAVPWAPYTSGSTLFAVRGNHESYFLLEDSRSKWSEYFGTYVADQEKYAPQVKFFSTGASVNSANLDSRGFTFAFEYQNAFFVLLDQYDKKNSVDVFGLLTKVPSLFCLAGNTWTVPGGQPSPNGNWLDGVLSWSDANASRLEHSWVFGHSPLYATGRTPFQLGDNGTAAERDQLVELMAKYGVEIYFTGHDHLWDHSVVRNTKPPRGYENIGGIHQVLVGTGGADLDDGSGVEKPFTNPKFLEGCEYESIIQQVGPELFHRHDNRRMGYVLVTVEGKKVTMRLVSYDVRKGDFDHLGERAPAFDSVWTYGAPPR